MVSTDVNTDDSTKSFVMEFEKNLFAIISGANLEPTFDLFADFLPIYTTLYPR